MGAPDIAERKGLVEFAAKAAENFVSAYYAATDAPHRVQVRRLITHHVWPIGLLTSFLPTYPAHPFPLSV